MRLIDADKLKEKLRGNAQKDGSPFVGAIAEMFCEFLDQAPTFGGAEERGEIGRVPQWIPATERLPDDENEHLVIVNGVWKNIHFKGACEMATYSADEGWILSAFPDWDAPVVTYWMPLPGLPEVE